MYDSMLHLQMQEACMQLNRGYEVNWGAMPLSGVFETTDGAVCMVGGFTPDPLARISEALGLDEDLTQRPEFANLEQQFKHKPALQAIFRERIATNTTEYWTTRLEDQGLLNAPVHTLEQALADAQTQANGMIVEAEHPGVGTVRMLNAPDPALRHPAHRPARGAAARRAQRGGPAGERLRRRDHRAPAAAGGAPVTAVSVEGTTAAAASAAAAPVDQVTLTIENHVATVVIDRQHVLNAVDGRAQARLNEIWDQLEADPDVRAVVITGAGTRAFCVGADMSSSAVDKTGLEYWAGLDPNGFGGLSLRTSLDMPVIARVNGYALGGGMEIVLGADIVVAADTARFGLTEPRVGRLALDGGIHQLVRRIPYTQAMGMLLTGRKAEAAEMQAMGLVNEVVPAEELDAAVQRWLDQILACAPTSVRAVKQMVTQTGHLTATEARGLRLPALMAALDSEDSAEGVRAFQEKRPPVWPGR